MLARVYPLAPLADRLAVGQASLCVHTTRCCTLAQPNEKKEERVWRSRTSETVDVN